MQIVASTSGAVWGADHQGNSLCWFLKNNKRSDRSIASKCWSMAKWGVLRYTFAYIDLNRQNDASLATRCSYIVPGFWAHCKFDRVMHWISYGSTLLFLWRIRDIEILALWLEIENRIKLITNWALQVSNYACVIYSETEIRRLKRELQKFGNCNILSFCQCILSTSKFVSENQNSIPRCPESNMPNCSFLGYSFES